jgi:hypothetical protein
VLAGTADHLFEHPDTTIDYLKISWIMSVRGFLRMHKVRMEFTEHSHPVALRDKNAFIMDVLRTRGQCTAGEMKRLNACRMHLRVSWLLEIASADGTSLRPDLLKGLDSGIHPSEARWPRQARPLHDDWTFWSNKLRAVFSSTGTSTILLGPWQPTLDPREWTTLVSIHTAPAPLEVFRT